MVPAKLRRLAVAAQLPGLPLSRHLDAVWPGILMCASRVQLLRAKPRFKVCHRQASAQASVLSKSSAGLRMSSSTLLLSDTCIHWQHHLLSLRGTGLSYLQPAQGMHLGVAGLYLA